MLKFPKWAKHCFSLGKIEILRCPLPKRSAPSECRKYQSFLLKILLEKSMMLSDDKHLT